MKIPKAVVCGMVGHKFETPSIVNTMCSNNWIKQCSRCGIYIMHGDIGSVPLTKKQAFKIKREFEEAFPYSITKNGGDTE